jgi:hypothetical protein
MQNHRVKKRKMLQCVGASLVRLSQTSVVQGFGPPDRLALQWDRKGSG